jgi:hypothetical protein
MPRALRRRSSWPSSFVTALIGWNGLATLVALAFGRAAPPLGPLLLAATGVALAEVPLLRACLAVAPGGQRVLAGAAYGAATALALALAPVFLVPALSEHPFVALGTAGYAGAAVGAFLWYFRRDDARLERAAAAVPGPAPVPAPARGPEPAQMRGDVDYGRDAHWLDPFAYGAALFAVVCLPRSPALAVATVMVGAFTGVVAAGVSHFFLSRAGNARWTIAVAVVAGGAAGTLAGFLLRGVPHPLLPAPWPGAIAGALTFGLTAAVGRRLALRERAPEPNR